MNHDQAALVGGPGMLSIASVDKEGNPIVCTYIVGKPSAMDLITMQKWVMSQKLGSEGTGICAKDLEGLSPEHQALLIKEYAKAKQGKRAPTEAEVVELIYSPEGVARQVWLAARHNHTGLRLEEIRVLITDNNCDQVCADLDAAVNGRSAPDPTGVGDPKKPVGATS